MYEKLKSFLADDALFMVLLMLLVGVVSFGLGRHSVVGSTVQQVSSGPAGVIFTDNSLPFVPVLPTGQEKFLLIASRSGTKYHLTSCPGAAQIKEENKLYFDSIALAEAAGYTPAANCPGL